MDYNRSEELIYFLSLEKHPEGGYFKETYRSESVIEETKENSEFPHGRNFGTSIYFLLKNTEFSALHKIKSDEIWHFYEGNPLEIISIDSDGFLEVQTLGNDLKKGQIFQCVVKAGKWFGSRLQSPNSYALVGCTVAPGFDFQDFEMAEREKLILEFPQHSFIISELTR